MAEVEPELGNNGNESNEISSNVCGQEEDSYLPVEKIAERFGVSKHAIYKAVRNGRVRAQKRVTLVSVQSYREYHKYAKRFWPVRYEGREPNEREREVLRLKAEGHTISATARQVFGNDGGSNLKKVRAILEAFDSSGMGN